MKIGIYEKAINNKFNWEEKILIAKKSGYDFIEFSVDESDMRLARLEWNQKQIDDLKTLLVKHHFKFNSMTLSAHRKYPFGSRDEHIRNKAMEIMRKAIRLAKELGIYNIQLAGYDVYYEDSDKETKKNFLKGIKEAVKLAQKNTIMLSFEIMDTPFMGTISKALKYVKKVNSPWLQIYPDLGNIYQWATNSLEKEFRKGKNNIVGLHFKDTKPGVFRDTPWGEGTVDFVRLFKILKNIQYNGPFLIEMWSKNESKETKTHNIKLLKEAKNFFEKKRKKANYE